MRKFTSVLLVLVLCAALLCIGAAAAGTGDASQFAGGDGTPENPYKIATAEQLKAVGDNRRAHYVLIADIDLGGETNPWTPIGSGEKHAFTGTFDGDGHTISGLYINNGDSVYAGLFGYVGSGGMIKDLTVEGEITISGSTSCVGGIAGFVRSSRQVGISVLTDSDDSETGIIDCTSNVTINVTYNGLSGLSVGGIVGSCGGATISGCENYGDVSVVSASKYGIDVNIGGIVGYSYSSPLSNCSNTGAVSAENAEYADIGGVVGDNNEHSDVSNCYNTGAVSVQNVDEAALGGVVGYNYDDDESTVSNCYNAGDVSAEDVQGVNAGGVVGENRSGSVISSYNTGDLTAENVEEVDAGGVVGFNSEGTVGSCYNTGEISAENVEYASVGGVVGLVNRRGTVGSCYNTGDVIAKASSGASKGEELPPVMAGGVVGRNSSYCTVSNCYSIGTVSGENTEDASVGGVAGYSDGGDVTGCYYLSQDGLDGIGANEDEDSKTDAFPLTQEQFADTDNFSTDWDFNNTWIIGTPSEGGFARPMLRYNLEIAEGSGTEDDPYIIPDLETLEFYRDMINAGSDSKYNSANYILTADIELNGSETNKWTPIGSDKDHAFTGTFDGDGYTISGLYINGDASTYGVAGLFGSVGEGGTVENLNVEGSVTVSDGDDEFSVVGGVVGSSSGTVSSCNSSVKVSGGAAGGVVGINRGTVSNCTNTGNVTGTTSYFYAGGVVGSNEGTVENCYNTGKVSGSGFSAGGVVGDNSGTVSNCYNTGGVSVSGIFCKGGAIAGDNSHIVSNCYYLEQNDLPNIGADSGTTTNVKNKTAEEFASGDVAWLLQYGQDDQVWGQNLGDENSLPMLTSEEDYSVIQVTFKENEEDTQPYVAYTNYGGTVTFPENPTPPGDQVFDGWYSGDAKYDSTAAFTEDTTLTAKFAAASTYTVTVNGSYAGETGAGSYIAGASVTVSAGERAGYSFAGWTAEGVVLIDASAENVTFTMPANDVTLTAEWDYIVTPSDPTYRPIIDEPENGGVTTSPSRPEAGDTVTVNPEPDEGYEVDEIIVTDKDGNPVEVTRNPDGSYSFTQPEGAVTIEVTFRPVCESGLPFADVNSGDWFYDYVEYVYANGLMDGTSDTTFEPNSNMTRAMVWAILARIDGETVTGANWVETAREWAMANGVSDGENANGYVTREQLATMLWRYAGEPESDYSLSAFTDAGSVSDYAATAMAWAVEHGIITGMTDTTLEPQGTATRAQCAAMLMRFVEL